MPALFLRKLKSLRSVFSYPLLFYSVIFYDGFSISLYSLSIKNMHGQITGEFLCVSDKTMYDLGFAEPQLLL